jgi:predicted amidohydrolase
MEWYGLKLSLLTCIDLADFTAVAHVVKYGEGIDLLLTPACTDKEEKLYECARVTSEAMPGLVAFVNTGKADKRNGVALFGFGRRIAASSKPPWIADLVEEDVDECKVIYVELIHDTFRYRRTGLRSGQFKRGHPLFGLPTIASD